MTVITTISDQADVALVEEEGDVLKAYRCPAGVWSIGTGLTAASGVIKPVKGMTITRQQSRELRRKALARNYEPRVVKALPTDKQNVFDGAVLFDFNTGAIHRASWVDMFRRGSIVRAEQSFLSWNKAGGKVLDALTRRRRREWAIIEKGVYGTRSTVRPASSVSDFANHATDFQTLGYDTTKGAITTVVHFQRDHGLTQDGVIGPATRAALERALHAKTSTKAVVGGATVGGSSGLGVDAAANGTGPDAMGWNVLLWVGGAALALALVVWALTVAWRYRGPLFAWLPEPVKDWFEDRGIVLGRRVRT